MLHFIHLSIGEKKYIQNAKEYHEHDIDWVANIRDKIATIMDKKRWWVRASQHKRVLEQKDAEMLCIY